MTTLNIEQLKTYIAEEKWVEAKQFLEDFFHQTLTGKEQGTSILKETSIYLETINSLNRQHVAILDNAIAMLREIDTDQIAEEKEIDLKSTRIHLKDI